MVRFEDRKAWLQNFCVAVVAACSVLCAVNVRAAAPEKTIVDDAIYRADGTPAQGTLLISWPAFTTSSGEAVAAGSLSAKIGVGGVVKVGLVANTGSTPQTSYKVTLKSSDGTTSEEYWTVPKASTTTISAIRSRVVTAGVAQQFVGRDYVDSKVAEVAGTDALAVHKTGDEIVEGTKDFRGVVRVVTPTLAEAAVPKSYVDAGIAAVQSSVTSLQPKVDAAATKEYVDSSEASLQQSINSDLQSKVNDATAVMVRVNPVADQVVAQPEGTSLKVNRISVRQMNGTRFADEFPGADAGEKITAAMAELPANGGVVDARGLQGIQSFALPLTITKPVTLLLGDTTITGAIVVKPGVTGVSIRGVRPWGSQGPSGAVSGTTLKYTGTAAAVTVGDSTADTYEFELADVYIDLDSAGAAAIGVALNRTVHSTVSRVRIDGTNTANTREGIRLDGTGNFTAYNMIDQPYISKVMYGIRCTGGTGVSCNANTIIGGSLLGASVAGSIGFWNEKGDSNAILGTDFEGWDVGLKFYGSNNVIPFVRLEGNTTHVWFDISASSNTVHTYGIETAKVTDNSSGANSVVTSRTVWTQANGNTTFRNFADSPFLMSFRPGNTTEQVAAFQWQQRDGSALWGMGKTTAGGFYIRDEANNYAPISLTSSRLDVGSRSSSLRFNANANSTTNGVEFWSGGASPAKVADVNGSGEATFNGGVRLSSSGQMRTRLEKYTAAVTPVSVAANSCAEQAFTVAGVQAADIVLAVNRPSAQAGVMIGGWRTAGLGSVAVQFCNITTAAITPSAGTYSFAVMQ